MVFNQRTAGQLAQEKVRYVGEPIAMVVAESRYLAEDAAEAIEVDYEPLARRGGPGEAALADGAPLVHEDVGSNLAAHVDPDQRRLRQQPGPGRLVIARRFHYDRGSAAPMEGRGVVAQWDALARHLTVWDSTQAPDSHPQRPGRHARPVGAAGARDRAVRGRAGSAPRS